VKKSSCLACLVLFTLLLYWQQSANVVVVREQGDVDGTSIVPRLAEYELVANKPTKLEFVHITKTGGTAIEEAASRAGIDWGICHYEHVHPACFHPRADLGWPRVFALQQPPTALPYPNFTAEYWHTPPHWFRDNPFRGRDTFTVVRNPYDRYISEFYCKHYGYHKGNTTTTATVDPKDRLRRFQELTKRKKEFQARKAAQVKHGSRRRLMEADDNDTAAQMNEWLLDRLRTYQGLTGHMLPQHYYVYDSNGKQVITHVLKFETLAEDFEALMRLYNLRLRLPTERINAGHATKRLTRKDLSVQVVEEINKFAKDDFRLFGYDMMD
jgi:hypothetical protein